MLLHSLVGQSSVLLANTFEDDIMSLHQQVGLRNDCNVIKTETRFVSAAIELTDHLKMLLSAGTFRYQHLICVLNSVRSGIGSELPVVEAKSVGVFKHWLTILDPICCSFERHCDVFRHMFGPKTIVLGLQIAEMGGLMQVHGLEEGEVTKECSVESSIINVHFPDLIDEIRKLFVDCLAKFVFG